MCIRDSPYPSITDGMAMASHMYICRTQSGTDYEYVKCQTLKPYSPCQVVVEFLVDISKVFN